MVHLIVFIHGLNGFPSDFDQLERVLLAHHAQQPESQRHPVVTLKISSNAGLSRTLDGIENGAVRVWREVVAFEKSRPAVTHFSFIAHSLGGLYARFALRLLSDCMFFERIQPLFFVTLATPHLGVRRPQNTPFNVLFQNIVVSAAARMSPTVRELSLEDGPSPILYRMTDDSFVSVLKLFPRRILYSNVAQDFQVMLATSSILPRSPYGSKPRAVASSTPSRDFPSLTQWSLDNCSRHVIVDGAMEDFAVNDPRQTMLSEMLVRLNSMAWERYDAVFSTVFAHEQIINKRSFMAGKDVARHLSGLLVGGLAEQESRIGML